MPYAWLLFDADDTLFDYQAAERHALLATLRAFEIEPTDAHLSSYRSINADCWQAFERGAMAADQLRLERYERWTTHVGLDLDAADLGRTYLGQLATRTDLIEGAQALLTAVQAHFRLGLVTNGLADVQRGRLSRSPVAPHFDIIVISDEEGVSKPDPQFFDIAFERMGAPSRSDVLIIGDNLNSDIAGGLRYGIDTCWFNPHAKVRPADAPLPHHEVPSLHALQHLLLG